MHGGKSTGPRTAEGLERSRKARWRHGHYSAEAKAERREARAGVQLLRKLLDPTLINERCAPYSNALLSR